MLIAWIRFFGIVLNVLVSVDCLRKSKKDGRHFATFADARSCCICSWMFVFEVSEINKHIFQGTIRSNELIINLIKCEWLMVYGSWPRVASLALEPRRAA